MKEELKNVTVNTFYFSDNSIVCIAVLDGFCSWSEGHFIWAKYMISKYVGMYYRRTVVSKVNILWGIERLYELFFSFSHETPDPQVLTIFIEDQVTKLMIC